jgi:Flp pilus assembly protein TadB
VLVVLLSLVGGVSLRLVIIGAVMTLMGWRLPLVRVQRRARHRIERIDREVPELVDLLVTTVEAGVGFAAGLQLASRSIEGPLGQELRLALREQSLGLSPEEALRNLSLRVDSPAMAAFTQALVAVGAPPKVDVSSLYGVRVGHRVKKPLVPILA